MKARAAALLLLAFASAARADLVVTQRVEGGGQSGEQVIRIKDGKARCDLGDALSIIVDRESGVTLTLAHAQHGFVTLTAEQGRALLEKTQKARGAQPPPKLAATGRKDRIGDQACEVFTAELGALRLTYWLAAAYPNYPRINAQLDILESAPLAAANSGLAPRTKDLPGLPMKIVMEMSGQKVTVTTLSVKEETVDAAIFTVPADYRELASLPPTKP